MNLEPKLESRCLADLHDYPLQAVFSGSTNGQDDQDLHESIDRGGLRQAIETLPENQAGLLVDSVFDV